MVFLLFLLTGGPRSRLSAYSLLKGVGVRPVVRGSCVPTGGTAPESSRFRYLNAAIPFIRGILIKQSGGEKVYDIESFDYCLHCSMLINAGRRMRDQEIRSQPDKRARGASRAKNGRARRDVQAQ